ncbi:polyprenyl synthetase [Streptomyces sp. NPDC013953]|uniref:polyprenyl synthetase n=1 Tax=Streptomyces sp. NPDC013953 TaxID=3364868 RepID=UPI003700928A
MPHTTPPAGHRDQQALLIVAGMADLAVTAVGSAAGAVRSLLRRSDAAELVKEAEADLEARGRLALDRYGSVPPAYLEVLAQRVLARQAAAGGDV